MRVNSPHQVFYSCFQFHGSDGFGDQFRRLRTDDMHSQNLSVLCVRDDLNKALMFADDGRAGIRRERKFADLQVMPQFTCLRLG